MNGNFYRITSIVEGRGDRSAVPAIIQRWIAHKGLHEFRAVGALCAKGVGNLLVTPQDTRNRYPNHQRGVEYFVRVAVRERADAILIVLDADDQCIQRERARHEGLGPEILRRARAEAPHVPVGVVVADRMFEGWLLTPPCLSALKGAGLIAAERWPKEPLSLAHKAGCKGVLSDLLGRTYSPEVDQLNLSRYLQFTDAFCSASRSYGKLLRELERLTGEARARRRGR